MDMYQHDARGRDPESEARGAPSDLQHATFRTPEHLDTLLEAHASIVSEIRTRVAHPDIDGTELVALAKAVAALDAVIELVAEGVEGEANAPTRV
ncbi:MAG TPA: hypothetical protein ENN10_01700 [Actinobacteria bacterium]|nr:hypothetical protein [Actinomycetota bacterium]